MTQITQKKLGNKFNREKDVIFNLENHADKSVEFKLQNLFNGLLKKHGDINLITDDYLQYIAEYTYKNFTKHGFRFGQLSQNTDSNFKQFHPYKVKKILYKILDFYRNKEKHASCTSKLFQESYPKDLDNLPNLLPNLPDVGETNSATTNFQEMVGYNGYAKGIEL